MILIFRINLVSSQVVETPVIDYVTVNHLTGKPVVSWLVNDPGLISGYSIKRFIYSCSNTNYASNSFHTIHVINDPNQLLYEDNSTDCIAEPNIRKEIYGVIAFKIDGLDTTRSSIDALHQTMYLQTEFDYCNKKNILRWNNYISWGAEFINYEIYCKLNSGGFIKIGTKAYNDTIFLHEDVNLNTNYEYYIKATRIDGTESLSNIKSLFTQSIDFPDFLTVKSLEVKNQINFSFNIDKNSETERYILYKASNKNGEFDSISGMIHPDENLLHLTDNYNQSRNFYYLSAIDYCGNEIFKSDTVSNILLNANTLDSQEKINLLQWEYDLPDEFQVFRCINENFNCSEIDLTFDLNYSDNIQSIFENQLINQTSEGVFCYWVQTEEDNFLNISNTDCILLEETVFIANAFNPNSRIEENRVFKPKIAFVSDYELIIYGNFGNIIFQSRNPDVGWSGILPNGRLADRASYLYFLTYTNSFGKQIKQKGIVSLVY